MSLQELRPQAKIPVGPQGTFRAFDMMAVTLEDGDFLYALVRVTKPRIVVESGSGSGISGTFIATALQDNGFGELVTYENAQAYYELATEQLKGLPAEVRLGEAVDYPWRDLPPEIVYIDSDMGRRHNDLKHFLTCGYRGIVVLHDANREFPNVDEHGEGVYLPGADGLWVGRSKYWEHD